MSRQVGAKKYQKYTVETLEDAVSMIKGNALSFRKASTVFGIPKSTLSNRLTGKSEVGCRSKPGTMLT